MLDFKNFSLSKLFGSNDVTLNWVDGQHIIERDELTGVIVWEEWYTNGTLDRPNDPAIVQRDKSGAVTYQAWYRNGELGKEIDYTTGSACVLGP